MSTAARVLVPLDEVLALDRSAWPAPDMSILNEGRRPAPTVPLSLFGRTWSDWMARTAESCNAPVDYVAGSLLAVASCVLGNSRRASPWPGWAEGSTLWIANIGSVSSSKSPASDPGQAMLREIEHDLAVDYVETLRRWERDRESAACARAEWQAAVKTAIKNGAPAPDMPACAVEPEKPLRPRLILSDASIEEVGRILATNPRGLLHFRDELSGWLTSMDRYSGGGDRAFWIECFGGRRYVVDRVKNNEPIFIPHLSVAKLGGIQPDRLASLLMSGDDDGLTARFLFLWPDPVPPRRPTSAPDHGPAGRAIRRLYDLPMSQGERGPEPATVYFSDAAADLFQSWRVEHGGDDRRGRLAGHFGKLPGIVVRLALLLEYLWWSVDPAAPPPPAISNAAVGAACEMVNSYFKPMAERAFGDAALPPEARHAAALARHIQKVKASTINGRSVKRSGAAGTRDTREVDAALAELEAAYWLRPAPSRVGSGNGRQRADYEVNPAVHEVGP